ncbi:hypothetical protein, partial [Arthrobacter sp. Br18]|uniref:hypothetical protein n=1 Tax=Arthrobacter sp. Br18 TaxID=1312954 RepID=UPI00056595F5
MKSDALLGPGPFGGSSRTGVCKNQLLENRDHQEPGVFVPSDVAEFPFVGARPSWRTGSAAFDGV